MQIRKLKTRDIFPLSRIVAKLDLVRLSKMVSGDAEQVGMLIVGLLAERLADMESDLFPFLADLCGIKTEEFAELPMADLRDVVTQLMAQPEVAGFFGSAKQDTA